MPTYYMFKCQACNDGKLIAGPEVKPNGTIPAPNTVYNSVPGVKCPSNVWHVGKPVVFVTTQFFPPQAPPMPAPPTGPSLPSSWVLQGDGSYVKALKYPHIPDTAQTSLIHILGPILGDASHRVPLLGATYDRFDEYGDVEDMDATGHGTAEKWLTLPMVLDRLNKVSAALASPALWKLALIDRPKTLNGKSCHVQMPSGVDNYHFHMELLNDLINPRGGHCVPAETYSQAIKKAIALRKDGKIGEDSRHGTHGFYFHSSRSKRGVNVVLQEPGKVMTVYFSSAATAWWAGSGLSAEIRLARTVA